MWQMSEPLYGSVGWGTIIMLRRLSALVFAMGTMAMLSVTPDYAVAAILSVDSGLITVDEANGQYVVTNDINSGLWIYAFGVTNSSLGGSVGGSGPYSNWGYIAVPIGNNSGQIPNANGYLAHIASIDSNFDVTLPTDIDFSNLIGPGVTASGVFFHTGAPHSDLGVLAIDVNGGQFQFETFANSTPLPAALPLFASGLGVIGLLARRRRARSCA
jgi:hypothetical protein